MADTVKTAISIQSELFEQIKGLAKKLNVSRSKVFAMAAREFIRKDENKTLLSQINEAFDDHPLKDEVILQNQMKQKQLKNLKREQW